MSINTKRSLRQVWCMKANGLEQTLFFCPVTYLVLATVWVCK